MNDWRDDNQTLCHCHGVKAGVVRQVVRELQPSDPREVGLLCKAGTGCRSCIPDISLIMAQESRASGGFWRRLRRLFHRNRQGT